MKVKIYGSNSFTPVGSGVPGDTFLPRAAAPQGWAGTISGNYDNYAWRTDGDWCYGSYARDDFSAWLDDMGTAGCECGLATLQDSDDNTGWETTLNWASNKRILLRAGHDLASGAIIHYVRVHIRVAYNDKAPYQLRPYYQVIGTQGDAGAPFGAGASGSWGVETGDSVTYFNSALRTNQYSQKLTSSPVNGRAFDKSSLYHTAWGVISNTAAPSNNVYALVSEMAIEVGYDESAYVVTTGMANPAATSVVLHGSVDPKGDAGGTWFFEYGLNPFLGSASAEVPAPATTLYNVQLLLNGLTADETYYYRLVARDSDGNLTYGATKSFLTVSMCSTRPLLVL